MSFFCWWPCDVRRSKQLDISLSVFTAYYLIFKWFSESGKLVQRLFEHILELADDDDSLVCVLVDEVTSSDLAPVEITLLGRKYICC